MAVPDPSQVAPWYLRNITQALELDEATGNVFVRTNAALIGNVSVGNVSIGALGNVDLTSNTLPVTVSSGNVTVLQGTTPWVITGNTNAAVSGTVAATQSGAWTVNVQDGGNTLTVDGTVAITGNIAGITALPPITGSVTITGNANVAGNVGILGNVVVTDGGGSLTVDGTVGVSGTVNANITGGNVNAVVTGNVTTTPSLSVGDFYGEPYSIPITPVVQTTGIYGINSLDHQTYTAVGGNVTTADSAFVCSTTASAGSYALIRSRRFNTFKAGQSLMARFYTQFDTPVANTQQRVGIQNQVSGYWIGYNGTTFGVLHSYGAKAPIYKVTLTSYTGNQTVTLTLNSVAYTINIAVGETVNNAAQRIALANFNGLWLANQIDNTVELLYTGTGPLGGTFSISSSGNLVSSITQQVAGVAMTDEWAYDGVDFTMPAWFDAEAYNQYQIKYSWAGVNFFVLDQTTGQYQLFYQHLHNGGTILPVANPAFKVATLAYTVSGSSGVSVNTASMMAGLEGITNRNNFSSAASTTQTSLSQNVLHHIISIQNPYTFNQNINGREAILQDLTISMQCNDPTEVFVYVDAPLATGLQDFVSQNGLPVTVSEVTGTINPATNFPIMSFIVGITGSTTQFDLSNYRTVCTPGSTISVAVQSTATIQKASAAIVWYND